MDKQTRDLIDLAEELDNMDKDVTSWEAGLLDTVLKQGNWVSDKQARILLKMEEKYLTGS